MLNAANLLRQSCFASGLVFYYLGSTRQGIVVCNAFTYSKSLVYTSSGTTTATSSSSSSHHMFSCSNNNNKDEIITDEGKLRAIEEDVQKFWFEEIKTSMWFAKDDAFDSEILQRFGESNQLARKYCLDEMKKTPNGLLALIILLDQFNRNLYRGTPNAFSSDDYCVHLVEYAISNGFDEDLFREMEKEEQEKEHENGTTTAKNKLQFLLMPLMHSEDISKHDLLLQRIDKFRLEQTKPHALQHRADIQRFGRYPSRNIALGRVSTLEEEEYLNSPSAPNY